MKITILICNRIIYLLFPLIHSRKTIFFFFRPPSISRNTIKQTGMSYIPGNIFSKEFSATGNCTFQRQLRGDRVAFRTNVTCVHPKN